MYRRILVPYDGSDPSRKALVSALELARTRAGTVRVLHLLDPMASLTGFEPGAIALQVARDYADKALVGAMDLARAAGVQADCKVVDRPGNRLAEVVADEARDFDADLVVVGTHGRRGVGRVLLGSDAEQVIRMAPVPVLAVRHSTLQLSTRGDHMSSTLQDIRARIQAQWKHLTEDDLHKGLSHRETFLERLCHRHHIGLDEAETQLREFEKKNPELLFERS